MPTRIQTQVDLILKSLPDAQPFYPEGRDEGAGPDFLAHRGRLLVRDADVVRAREAIERHVYERDNAPAAETGKGSGRRARKAAPDRRAPAPERSTDPVPPVSRNGITRLPLDERLRSTQEALEAVDRQLGPGVLVPDHVFYLTRISSCCPAKEPAQVAAGYAPVPAVRRVSWPGCCDGAGALVSVIDTGLFQPVTAPWMAGVQGDLELPHRGDPPRIRPYAGHGAFCAGVVRAMAPKADVYVENAFEIRATEPHRHPDGLDHPHDVDASAGAAYESDLADEAVEALKRGPDIICLAFGTPTRAHLAPLGFEALRLMLEQRKGVVVVAAAGCDGSREPFWPAAAPWTLSVGSLGDSGRTRASWSNYGGWVDVYVPGENLVNVFPTGSYVCDEPPYTGQVRQFDGLASWSGTSFSCALMAGLIAARMSSTGQNAPHAAAALLEQARGQALPGVGPVLYPGHGCQCDGAPA